MTFEQQFQAKDSVVVVGRQRDGGFKAALLTLFHDGTTHYSPIVMGRATLEEALEDAKKQVEIWSRPRG